MSQGPTLILIIRKLLSNQNAFLFFLESIPVADEGRRLFPRPAYLSSNTWVVKVM